MWRRTRANASLSPSVTAPADASRANQRYAVVDTNAIIKGMRLEALGAQAVTTSDVLKEVRDSASRHVLETLPFGITVREPEEDALAAVRRFAKLTGDITVLSTVDLKVVALAYSLEKAAHGAARPACSPARSLAPRKTSRRSPQRPVPALSSWLLPRLARRSLRRLYAFGRRCGAPALYSSAARAR